MHGGTGGGVVAVVSLMSEACILNICMFPFAVTRLCSKTQTICGEEATERNASKKTETKIKEFEAKKPYRKSPARQWAPR